MKPLIQKFMMMVAMLLSFLTVQAYDFEVEGIQYSIVSISDKTCEIEKVTKDAGVEVSIPKFVTYKGNSFEIVQLNSHSLLDATIKKIDLSQLNVVSIAGSFSSCTTLESVILPSSLLQIGSSTFHNCKSLKEVSMPNTVEEIGGQAFMGCLSLENILLSSSLKTIDTQAFENCESLENIAIPSLVENIGTFAFRNCKSVKTLSFEGSESSPTLEIPQIGFYYDDPSFYDIGAFTNCDPMTIRIDRNISYTPNGNIASKFAFKYAPTILNIGEHCSSVDKYLWKNGNISNLLIEDRTINLVLPNAFSVDYLYLGGNVNMPISAANVNIGPKVTELPNEMFNGSSFESIILPSGITQIGEYAFSNCVNITSIIIPDEIVKIPTGCFNGCSALTRVVLPESILR